MKLRAAIILALLSQGAGAADWYVNPRTGNDANAGTQAAPKATVGSITQTNGDVIYVAAGETLREQITVAVDNLSLVAWGAGRVLIDCEYLRDYGVYSRGFSNLRLDGVNVTRCLNIGIDITNNTATTTKTGPTLRRVDVSLTGGSSPPGGEDGQRYGTGINIGSGPTSGTAVLDGVVLEDVRAYDNKKHGIDFVWRVLNVRTKRVEAYNNGLSYSGHGLTHHPILATITSGWTAVGGGVYSRAKVTSTDPMSDIKDLTTPSFLTQNTATPTTPAAGEWGHSGATMYVHLPGDADPNGKSMYVKRADAGPFVHEDLYVHHNVAAVANEGHGMSADNFTSDVTCIRCRAHDNQGAGFKSFNGKNVRFKDSLSWANKQQGFDFVMTSGGEVEHVVATNNGFRGIQWVNGALNSVARNAVATYNDASGTIGTGTGIFMLGAGTGTLTQGGLYVFGNNGSTQFSNVTATVADPLLDSDFKPQPDSPLCNAGVNTGPRVTEGRRDGVKPAIGRWPCQSWSELP